MANGNGLTTWFKANVAGVVVAAAIIGAGGFAWDMHAKMGAVSDRLDSVDKRFEEIDKHLVSVERDHSALASVLDALNGYGGVKGVIEVTQETRDLANAIKVQIEVLQQEMVEARSDIIQLGRGQVPMLHGRYPMPPEPPAK